MSQVELPQLSLARYFELLKRRRWQLVPVSLLGLVIGGLIAFFIPRYFVAETVLVHNRVATGEATGDEDPFAVVVEEARASIPLAVRDALELMKWAEVAQLDQVARQQFERDLESRVHVDDANAGDRKRSFAKLRVRFRDRDGERSAAFLNTLVEVWRKQRLQELRVPALEQARLAKEKAERLRKIHSDYVRDKLDLERRLAISPDAPDSYRATQLQKEDEQRGRLEGEQRSKSGEAAVLQARLDVWRAALRETPEHISADSRQMQELLLKSQEAKGLIALMTHSFLAMQTFRPGTGEWESNRNSFELYRQQLQALVPGAAGDAGGQVPNPVHVELVKQIGDGELELAGLRAELRALEDTLAEKLELNERRLSGMPQYEEKKRLLDETKTALDKAVDEESAANERLSQLQRDLPVRVFSEALPPKAPTEPNIMVVALIGCMLGLGAAIGLILLLDFLQGTFKTVEDVERALTVPVLGGVSHLETEAERMQAVRGRRRVSLVAAAMLLLITVVLTIYYVDPTRLPPVVNNLLTLLLGPGS